MEWRKERPSTGASERCNGTWRPGLPGVLHPEEGPAMLRMRAGRGRIAWRVGNGAFVTGTCGFVNKARFRSGTGIVFQQNGHFCCPHCDKVVAFGFLPPAASSASRCLKGRGKTAVPQYPILFAYDPFQIPDDFTGPVFMPAGCFLRKGRVWNERA